MAEITNKNAPHVYGEADKEDKQGPAPQGMRGEAAAPRSWGLSSVSPSGSSVFNRSPNRSLPGSWILLLAKPAP